MKYRIRFFLFSYALLGALALLPGCGQDSENENAIDVYRHSMDGTPTSLDPAHASNIYANFLVINLYDTLYRYKYLARPYELEPNLADGLPQVSADGLIYTIRIKPGAQFIDDPAFPNGEGRVVLASDVVYSIKRQFDPVTRAQGTWLWQGRIVGLDEWRENGSDYSQEISGLRAVDDKTLQIQLVSPFPQLTHTLAQGFSAIVPREAVDRYGQELAIHPVGSGPYRLESFNNASAVLVRNTGFRTETFDLNAEGFDAGTQDHLGLEHLQGRTIPFMDRIEIEFIAEDAARWNAFIAGELDFVKVPVSQFDQVLQSRDPPTLSSDLAMKYHLIANLESGFVHTDFNMADPSIGYHPDPLQNSRNKALRCAIVKAFDWEKRNEIFYYGIGSVFPGIIPPAAPEYDHRQSTDSITRDLEAARALLYSHGWDSSNLPVLEYGFPSNVTERQMFEQFRSFMGEAGYPKDKIKPLTFATYGDYAKAFLNREVMLITTGWTMDYPDAQNTVYLFYGPNATPGSNSANYNNPEFNRLYLLSAGLQPSPERTAMYQEMNRIVINDCASISGVSRRLILLWNRDFTALPDRSFVGGYFIRFVAPADNPGNSGEAE